MRMPLGLAAVAASLHLIFACGSDSQSSPPPLDQSEAGVRTGVPEASTDAGEAGCSADVVVDPKNCGRCGHDCLGGACERGACQPVRLAVDRSNLLWMAIDATHVYFCEDAVQRLGRVPKAGGAVELVASACTYTYGAAVIDDTNIYVNEQGGIRVVPKQGLGAGSLILPGATAFAVDATNLYLLEVQSGGTGGMRLSRAAKPAGTPVTIGGLTSPGRVAHDATKLYVTDVDGIRQFSKTAAPGGPDAGSSLFVGGAPEPADVAVDSMYVYYASQTTGSVKRATKVGGSVDIVASGVNAPSAVAVDASGVYFASASAGLIMSCPLAGCPGDPHVLASLQAEPYGIAIDDVAVYWITQSGGTVMRVAK